MFENEVWININNGMFEYGKFKNNGMFENGKFEFVWNFRIVCYKARTLNSMFKMFQYVKFKLSTLECYVLKQKVHIKLLELYVLKKVLIKLPA